MMIDEVLSEIRSCSDNLKRAIIRPLTLSRANKLVTVNLVTDCSFNETDRAAALKVLKKFVPAYFSVDLKITKLTPDCEMVRKKIYQGITEISKAVAAVMTDDEITVTKDGNGFGYTVAVAKALAPVNLCEKIDAYLKNSFCGEFYGEIVSSKKNIQDLEVEETPDEIEYELPVRTFKIEDFEILEGDKIRTLATYIADLNSVRDEVVLCGEIEDIIERSYTNKNGVEKTYFNFILNDKTATANITYFPRLKTIEKIKALKAGDGIVCTGLNEEFRGSMRYTAKLIDLGKIPAGFVPEKRKSKPVPRYYRTVKPQPFEDTEQTDLFTQKTVPGCMLGKSFVVFDLETTGLNSSAVSGNMDKIIEIGAFKVENGEITQSFTTFVNPHRRLSEEIIALTGITEDMVKDAPACEDVMPDFFKFCDGSILVGHNAAAFDFKFVDYYCSSVGYILERKVIDTYPLSQELLYLSNYKLNTVAEKFGVTFNHHRAIDDALATAKIFIELIRMKKSLPRV